jgi:anti-sigma B factor antagonist
MAQTGNNKIVPGFDDGRDSGITILLERTEAEARCLKVHLSGRIDTYNSSYFKKSADMLISAGFPYLVFCCASLSYVSSSGIGAFANIREALKAKDGEMFMVDLQPQVFEVFKILGYTEFFSFSETADDAIENLRRSAGRRAPASARFPVSFPCPGCGTKLKALKPGKFLCSSCKARLVVEEGGSARPWSEGDALGGP